jgi:hypothetical protein
MIRAFILSQHFSKMRITPHNNHTQHSALAALARFDGFVQRVAIAVTVFGRPHVAFFLALSFEGHEDCFAELVCLELLVHAARQRVAVPLVLEGVFDFADFVVLAAHEGFDEEFAARRVGLVPVVGPVAFAFVLAQRGHVGDFAKVARRLELDVFGDVDTPALDFAVPLVLVAQLEHLVVGQRGEDVDEDFGIGRLSGHGVHERIGVFGRIIYLDSALLFLPLLLAVGSAICF